MILPDSPEIESAASLTNVNIRAQLPNLGARQRNGERRKAFFLC